MDHTIVMRTGRTLEVREYGDPGGHPIFFFHGLIGSHHQAAYIDEQARRLGLRVIAPNRPGVGRSEFVARASALEVAPDVEDLNEALGIVEFSVLGISGGTPYALATLLKLRDRVRTATIISGMGPTRLPGGFQGMDRRRRLFLQIGSRHPNLAKRAFRAWSDRFRARPEPFLDHLIATWSEPDRRLFRRREIYELFMLDMHQVFTEGQAPESLAQELAIYRAYGFSLRELPTSRRVVLWHGLDDTIVPPTMAWSMVRALPNAELHLVPGGHFMAVDAAEQIMARLRQGLETAT